ITMRVSSGLSDCTRTSEIKPVGSRWLPFVLLKPVHNTMTITRAAAANPIPKPLLTLFESSRQMHHLIHRVAGIGRAGGRAFEAEPVIVVVFLERLQHRFPR